MKKQRERVTFAGVTFSGIRNGSEGGITVPKPAFRKILQSGQAAIRCEGRYTDDYRFDLENDFGVTGWKPAVDLADELTRLWLEPGRSVSCMRISFDPQRREVVFSPYSNLSYQVIES